MVFYYSSKFSLKAEGNNLGINLINFYKLKHSWCFGKNSLDINTITIRISELYAFPEIEKFFDFFDDLPFLGVTFVMHKGSRLESLKLLSLIGIIK